MSWNQIFTSTEGVNKMPPTTWNNVISGGTTGVASVTNTDGNLSISPNTGDVVVNLSNSLTLNNPSIETVLGSVVSVTNTTDNSVVELTPTNVNLSSISTGTTNTIQSGSVVMINNFIPTNTYIAQINPTSGAVFSELETTTDTLNSVSITTNQLNLQNTISSTILKNNTIDSEGITIIDITADASTTYKATNLIMSNTNTLETTNILPGEITVNGGPGTVTLSTSSGISTPSLQISTYNMPTTDGSANDFLQTDGAGTVAWVAATPASGVSDVTNTDNNLLITTVAIPVAGTKEINFSNTFYETASGTCEFVYINGGVLSSPCNFTITRLKNQCTIVIETSGISALLCDAVTSEGLSTYITGLTTTMVPSLATGISGGNIIPVSEYTPGPVYTRTFMAMSQINQGLVATALSIGLRIIPDINVTGSGQFIECLFSNLYSWGNFNYTSSSTTALNYITLTYTV